MKKNIFYIVTACLMLIPGYLFAGWNTPDKGYFNTQKDIENEVSDLSISQATISFGGKLFNFINYNVEEIIVRQLTNNSSSNSAIKWSDKKQDNIPVLSNLWSRDYWQPAPVVFNNVLYLFVFDGTGNLNNATTATTYYSAYNAGEESWDTLQSAIGLNSSHASRYMAAVVADDKLCLIIQGTNGKASIFWTTDLITWVECPTDLQPNCEISAITKTYMGSKPDGTKKVEFNILIGYIDSNKHAQYAEYHFNASNELNKVTSQTISTETTYQSIALAEGTVSGDPSTGKCVQAFLKKNSKDNGYCRYRIQRYQSQNGGAWTKQENNLVKQNYLWADKQLNLTVVNFGVADTISYNISQYMCLIYRGYDDWDHPLNCAWAETDKLVYDPSKEMTQILAGPENTQYIGYIEGPPPYYLNNFGNVPDNYLNPSYEDISEVEFSTSSTSTTSSEIGYDVGGDVNFKSGFFRAGLSASFGQVWDSDYSKSITNTFTLVASEEDSAYYITSAPVINRAFYKIHDVRGNLIDSTYHFYMTDPHLNLEPANIGQGLNPGNPATYYNRPGINFPSFNSTRYGQADNSWTVNAFNNPVIKVDQSESQINTITAKLDLGFELGKMFDIGIDGSFDYSLKTTTSVGNEMKSWTRLNMAENPTDVSHLNYTTYWIKPVQDGNNWWLHEGALTQNTWCITYDVTYVKYKNGTSIGSTSNPEPGEPVSGETTTEQGSGNINQETPTKSSLAQNYPNPFKPTTFIKYQIGIEDPQNGSGNQGCQTKLSVFNSSGLEVATLVDEWKATGSYEVEFDASQLAPGVYFYSLQSGSFRDVKKLILLK